MDFRFGLLHIVCQWFASLICVPSNVKDIPTVANRIPRLTKRTVDALHHGLRDKLYQVNRTLGVLSKMFSLAEVWVWRPDVSNPCRHMKRYKERKRERFLSPEETERLDEVLRETENEMLSAVAAFRSLLLTGCRFRKSSPALGVRQG